MFSRNISWVGGPIVSRASRVSDQDWNQHEEVLRHHYEGMSLRELRAFMKKRHNFSPSLRQYIHQFGKWGLKKYNRATRNDRGDQHHNGQNEGASVTPSNGTTIHESPTIKSPAQPEVADQRAKRKIIVQEDATKRLKVANQENSGELGNSIPKCTQEAAENMSSEGEVTNQSPDNKGQISAALPLVIHNNSSTDSEILPDSLPVSEDHSQRQNNDEQTTTIPPPVIHRGYFLFPEIRTDPLLISEHQTSELSAIMKQLDSPDFQELVRRLKPVATEIIMIIADFLSASQCPTDAFIFFTMIVIMHRADPSIPQHLVEHALIGCARNAFSQAHIDIAKNMINHRVQTIENLLLSIINEPDCSMQKFVYQSLLTELSKQATPNYYVTLRDLVKTSENLPRFSILTAPRYMKPLMLYTVGSYVDWHNTEMASSSEPRREVISFSRMIRSCLVWCESYLQSKRDFMDNLRGSFDFCTDTRYADYLTLYHVLFEACVSSAKQGCLLPWTEHLESDLSITSARFIADISMMITRYPLRTSESLKPKQRDLYYNVILGCRTLNSLDENSNTWLVSLYFKAHRLISVPTPLKGLGTNDREFFWRPYVRLRVKEWLNIELPILPPLHIESQINVTSGETTNLGSSEMFSSTNPTLTGSLRSSNYSSFRAVIGYKASVTSTHSGLASTNSRSERQQTSVRFTMGEKWSLSQYIPRTPSHVSKHTDIDSITTHYSAMSLQSQHPEERPDKVKSSHMRCSPSELAIVSAFAPETG